MGTDRGIMEPTDERQIRRPRLSEKAIAYIWCLSASLLAATFTEQALSQVRRPPFPPPGQGGTGGYMQSSSGSGGTTMRRDDKETGKDLHLAQVVKEVGTDEGLLKLGLQLI